MTRRGQINLLRQYREELLLIKAQREGIELPEKEETKEKQKVLVLNRYFYVRNLKI